MDKLENYSTIDLLNTAMLLALLNKFYTTEESLLWLVGGALAILLLLTALALHVSILRKKVEAF